MKKAVLFIFIFCIVPVIALPASPAAASSAGTTVDDALNNGKEGQKEATEVQRPSATGTSENPPSYESPITFFTFVKMFAALGFVVALIYGLLKLINSKANPFNSYRSMENVGGIPLGSNKSVQLIRLGGRILVVGVGETVTLLKEIESEDEVSKLLREAGEQKRPGQPFLLLEKFKARNEKQEIQNQSAGVFKDIMKQQLEKTAAERSRILDNIQQQKDRNESQ